MERMLGILIFSGLIIFTFYGIEWYQSKQEVVTLSAEQISKVEATIEHSSISKDELINKETFNQANKEMSDQNENYKLGEDVASLLLPSIEEGYSVYWGADDDTLKQGVGMYVSQWTTAPDQGGHTVVSGHRDSVFTKLGDVKKGHRVFMEFEGGTYEYEVTDIWVTDANDRTVIVDKENPTLTITTCYPLDYLGRAPDRYIIQAKLIGVHK
ncbi:class D sortase [Alteribacter aurantiacus]|uniref:class D sortase n=1 Tax=Alteribacter aurantiacus TaxID=254410 RepID=UPI000406D1A8|nr:class D sortase [Alteribacter aurantiacus]